MSGLTLAKLFACTASLLPCVVAARLVPPAHRGRRGFAVASLWGGVGAAALALALELAVGITARSPLVRGTAAGLIEELAKGIPALVALVALHRPRERVIAVALASSAAFAASETMLAVGGSHDPAAIFGSLAARVFITAPVNVSAGALFGLVATTPALPSRPLALASGYLVAAGWHSVFDVVTFTMPRSALPLIVLVQVSLVGVVLGVVLPRLRDAMGRTRAPAPPRRRHPTTRHAVAVGAASFIALPPPLALGVTACVVAALALRGLIARRGARALAARAPIG